MDVKKLSLYTTHTSGVLLLEPHHAIGTNTKFGVSSDVYVISRVKNMPRLG